MHTPKTLADAGLTIHSTGEDRAEWLGQRRGKYTATGVTAIVGSNPYTKLIDVWNDFTDPEYDADAYRNRWLEERAAFGSAREPEILKWASEDQRTGGTGNPFIPSTALVGLPGQPTHVSTPDGFKFARENALVLIECKASQQNWERDGIPQHIYDQCQWQLYTTGAVTVWLAQELVEWRGRGQNKTAEVVGRYLTPIQPDQNRLDWLLAKVAWFDGLLAEGIAPESDIDLRQLDEPGFDATEEDIAEWEELREVDAKLTELAEIAERIAADTKRADEIKAQIKPVITKYEGRRIWLIGTRFTAKLIRGTRSKLDESRLPDSERRRLTTWAESETMKIEPNPEYVAAATAETEQEQHA